MGKSITVEPQQLKDAATKINEYADSFEQIYKSLLQQAGTMGEAWQGDDNLAYVEKINNLSTKLNQMVEKLRSSSDTLNSQAQNYDDRRSNNISQVANLSE